MFRKIALVAVIFVAACAPRREPVAAPTEVMEPIGSMQPPPVHALLGFRARLQLTSAQVAALDSIGQQVSTANGPLMDELREATAETSSPRGYGYRRRPRQLDDEERAALRKVRDNNRRAVEAVRTVLTAEQERTTCEIFDQDRPGTSAQPRTGQRRGMEGMRMVGRRTWPWCATPGAAPSTAPRP